MKHKNIASRSLPRLIIERPDTAPETEVGYLEVSISTGKVKVGSIAGREFRLMQCLFSPHNFLSAKYEPVTQTHERLYSAIRMSTDSLNTKLSDRQSAESEMISIVEKTLQSLQGGEVGIHLTFTSEGGKVRMDVKHNRVAGAGIAPATSRL